MNMDGLPLDYDAVSGLYKIIDEDLDNDSGVDEMPFLSYTSLASDGSTEKHSKLPLTWERGDDDGDDYVANLHYFDDDRDDDYRPNKACIPKKVKSKVRKNLKFSSLEMSMFSPDKRVEILGDPEDSSSTRHYARKERTPRTIQKMMERHRESERVRHHTLNESMKEVCLRVPGYDPDVKETKVIQMQRLIAYECFLENTVAKICAELGLKSKALSSGTNYITEAMKNGQPEDWQHYHHVMEEEPCSSVDDDDEASIATRVITTEMYNNDVDGNITRYKHKKISSPTVDSTTGNIVKVYDTSSQLTDVSVDSMWPTQSFMPILSPSQGSLMGLDSSQDSCLPFNSSQESGIRLCSQDNSFLNEDFDTLLDENLVTDPDNLKTITANFMREDKAPTNGLLEDMSLGFDLSSPLRPDCSILLQSPKSSDIWHSPVGLHYPDKSDCLGSHEMTSVSPETLDIIETKPKVRPLKELQNSPDNSTHSYVYDITDNDESHFNITSENVLFDDEDNAENKSKMSKVLYVKTRSDDRESYESYVKYVRADNANMVNGYVTYTKVESSNCGKNKRKRYTPLRARHPFVNLTNTEEMCDVKKPMTKVIKMCRKQDASSNIVDQRVPSTVQYKEKIISMPILKYIAGKPSPRHTVATDLRDANYRRVAIDDRVATQRLATTDPRVGTYHRVDSDHNVATIATGNRVATDPHVTTEHHITIDHRLATDHHITIDHRLATDHHITTTDHRMATDHHMVTDAGRDGNVDHRRSSWMNGFMMFCHVNRQRFIESNPGVHISHIQKMLGHVWRNMESCDKRPYNEKADDYSNKLGNTRQTGHINDGKDCLVTTSTTIDSDGPTVHMSYDGTNPYSHETNPSIIIL